MVQKFNIAFFLSQGNFVGTEDYEQVNSRPEAHAWNLLAAGDYIGHSGVQYQPGKVQ